MDLLLAFPEFALPEGANAGAIVAIIILSFCTSALTAAVGIGGGLALLAAMTALLPPAAVIPIHGAAQIGSNLSRFVILRNHVVWPLIAWFSGGAVLGAIIGGQIVFGLPPNTLRASIALFVLIVVWAPLPKRYSPGPTTQFTTGAVSSVLTMFIGATGPFVAAMVAAARLQRLDTVGTHAAAMVVQHGLKLLVFGFLGFAFADWAFIIASIVAAGAVGSFVGSRILKRIDEARFRAIFKIALSIVAFYLLVTSLVGMAHEAQRP